MVRESLGGQRRAARAEDFDAMEDAAMHWGPTELHPLDSGVTVRLKAALFTPQKRGAERPEPRTEAATDHALLFLTGWGDRYLTSQHALSQALANESSSNTYVLALQSLERGKTPLADGPDFLYEEARAAAEFVASKKFRHVTIVGFSQGCPRTANLEQILRTTGGAAVDGVVLFSPTGLEERDPLELLTKYAWHGGPELNRELKKASPYAKYAQARGAHDVQRTLLGEERKEFGTMGTLKNQMSELWDMAAQNPRYKEVRAPIVMITGLQDPVAARERILPSVEEEITREQMGEVRKGRRLQDVYKAEWNPAIWRDAIVRDKTAAARGALLKQNYFNASESVQWLVASKLGHHLVTILRPEQVAKTAVYLLNRAHRRKKPKAEATG